MNLIKLDLISNYNSSKAKSNYDDEQNQTKVVVWVVDNNQEEVEWRQI